MIAPAYYRSKLGKSEQESYKLLVNGLLKHKSSIKIIQSSGEENSIKRVVNAVHMDHPELFWVNFWCYKVLHRPFRSDVELHFELFLEQKYAESVKNTMLEKVRALSKTIPFNMTRKEQYLFLINEVANTTEYVDSGSAFWDHTAAGPLLKHSAVCEGVSKVFLFFCQYFNLPCAIVTGTLKGEPHAWNMVEIDNQSLFVDITSLLGLNMSLKYFPTNVFRDHENLLKCRYRWETI